SAKAAALHPQADGPNAEMRWPMEDPLCVATHGNGKGEGMEKGISTLTWWWYMYVSPFLFPSTGSSETCSNASRKSLLFVGRLTPNSNRIGVDPLVSFP